MSENDDYAEPAPREKTLAERYSEAAERTDTLERERDSIKIRLEQAQARLEDAVGEESVLRQELRQELQNREMR